MVKLIGIHLSQTQNKIFGYHATKEADLCLNYNTKVDREDFEVGNDIQFLF